MTDSRDRSGLGCAIVAISAAPQARGPARARRARPPRPRPPEPGLDSCSPPGRPPNARPNPGRDPRPSRRPATPSAPCSTRSTRRGSSNVRIRSFAIDPPEQPRGPRDRRAALLRRGPPPGRAEVCQRVQLPAQPLDPQRPDPPGPRIRIRLRRLERRRAGPLVLQRQAGDPHPLLPADPRRGPTANWVHGVQLSPDIYLRSQFVGGSAVYVLGWKPEAESRFSTLIFAGANRALIGGFAPAGSSRRRRGPTTAPSGPGGPCSTSNLFYKLGERLTLGVENDLFFHAGKAGEYLVLPFLTWEMGEHAFLQAGAGYYRFESTDQATFMLHLNFLNRAPHGEITRAVGTAIDRASEVFARHDERTYLDSRFLLNWPGGFLPTPNHEGKLTMKVAFREGSRPRLLVGFEAHPTRMGRSRRHDSSDEEHLADRMVLAVGLLGSFAAAARADFVVNGRSETGGFTGWTVGGGNPVVNDPKYDHSGSCGVQCRRSARPRRSSTRTSRRPPGSPTPSTSIRRPWPGPPANCGRTSMEPRFSTW